MSPMATVVGVVGGSLLVSECLLLDLGGLPLVGLMDKNGSKLSKLKTLKKERQGSKDSFE